MSLSRYKSILFLFLGALILSAATPLIGKLIELGAAHMVRGRNPISFCNVLFAGDLIAFFVLLLIYAGELRKEKLTRIGVKNWIICLSAAILSGVLFPALFFLGIEFANVVNVILLSTLEIPLMLLVGKMFFRESLKVGVVVGALFILTGIAVTAYLQEPAVKTVNASPDKPLYYFLATTKWSGEACVVLGTIFGVFSTFLSRYAIQAFSTAFYNLFRVGIGGMIFFWTAIVLFGPIHFAELFSPFLWMWMLVYGGVIIALRTYLNYIGLKHAKATEIAISSAIIPISSLFFAYLILGTVPGEAQWLGGSITILGILIALVTKLLEKERVVLQKPVGFAGN